MLHESEPMMRPCVACWILGGDTVKATRKLEGLPVCENCLNCFGKYTKPLDKLLRIRRAERLHLSWLLLLGGLILGLGGVVEARMLPKGVRIGAASFYTISSAIREGICTDAAHRQCLTASGVPLDDTKATCASWDYPFRTTLRVTGPAGNAIVCIVTDRGPARRLHRQGRILDLSTAAFQALAPLSQGIIQVTVKPVEK